MFDDARDGDSGGKKVRGVGDERCNKISLELLAPVEHRRERQHERCRAMPGKELRELVERSHGQRAGNDGNEERIDSGEHALTGKRDTGRAIEYRHVVAIGKRRKQRGEPPSGSLAMVEIQIEVTHREVGGYEIETHVIGRMNVLVEQSLLADELSGPTLHRRFDTEEERGCALRIDVPEQFIYDCPEFFEDMYDISEFIG